MRGLIVCLGWLLLGACTSAGLRSAAAELPADGAWVRHLRLRIAPAETKAFEALMQASVGAAQEARLARAHDWYCYRESPGRYWLVSFAPTAQDFALPTSRRPLLSLLEGLEQATGAEGLAKTAKGLEYHLEWTLLMQQKRSWATGQDMDPDTHPKARMLLRSIRPGQEQAFDQAVARRTEFLREQDYPLPVEGFVVRDGAAGAALQLVFARDWSSFHAADSFKAFLASLDEDDSQEYQRRKAELMPTMSSAEFYDADFLPEASFRSGESAP